MPFSTDKLLAPLLQELEWGEGPDLVVEPVLADFQRRKTPVPPSFAFPGDGRDILHDKDADGEELTEEAGQAQFPLPARFGGGRQLLLALPSEPALGCRQGVLRFRRVRRMRVLCASASLTRVTASAWRLR